MRVAFHTLGCKVNQYETQAIKEDFIERGAEIVSEEDAADVYIVNTCTVTNIADRKSRQYIRRMKSANPESIVVVTGCYAQVSAEEIDAMPEVDLVMGNGIKSKICDRVFEMYGEAQRKVERAPEILEREELDFYDNMGMVVSSELGISRAYIKIEEGCDRFCSYCMIPFARGPIRSRAMDEILEEAKLLLDKGFKELVLTGINTALYGTEEGFSWDRIEGESDLTALEALLSRLNEIDRDFRIRLSSLEPTVVEKENVERIIRYDKLCHHLHLSVQSGSTKVLESMNRHYTAEEYLEIVEAIRQFDPDYGITTDIIVGFAGETEEDFNESIEVVRKARFGRVHAFRYSQRKGTVGATMKSQVAGVVKAERLSRLLRVAEETANAFIKQNFEREHIVLVEEHQGQYACGYTDNYIRVYIEDKRAEIPLGEFCKVKLVDSFEDGCLAEAVEKGEKRHE